MKIIKKSKNLLINKQKRLKDIHFLYNKLYEVNPINEKKILFESFHGKSMVGDPYALFIAYLNDPKYNDYKIIWALNDKNNVVYDKLKDIKIVSFVKVGSKGYLYHLTSAKLLINNTSFPPYFIKKAEQIYVNTWHGTPYKTLGKDMIAPRGTYGNIQRNFLKSDYMLHASDYTKEKIESAHDLTDFWQGQALIAAPRLKLTRKSEKLEEFLSNNFEFDNNKETILYSPTWRGNLKNVASNFEDLITDYELIKQNNVDKNVLLKVHSLMYSRMDETIKSVVVPDCVDTNELIYYVDILISDYSSIIFDFALFNKKIINFVPDLDQYEKTRGLYLDVNKLPGLVVKDIKDLQKAIDNKEEIDYKKFNDEFNQSEMDIDALKDLLITKPKKNVKKQNVLVYVGGFENNGITKSFINFSHNFDYENKNLIVIDKNNWTHVSDQNASKLNKRVKMMYRSGSLVHGSRENEKNLEFLKTGKSDQIDLIANIFIKEKNRLLGTTEIEKYIDFSGYVNFWTTLFALQPDGEKYIYQHNNMDLEYKKVVNGKQVHKNRLKIVFNLYKYFDKIISVSKETMEINYQNLNEYYNEDQCDYIENYIDGNEINELKEDLDEATINVLKMIKDKMNLESKEIKRQEIIDLAKQFNFKVPSKYIKANPINNHINAGYFGRISPEKGQYDFIKKLPEITKQIPNILVIFAGNGAQLNACKQLAKKLNVEDNVLFVGHVNNPYAIMKVVDFMILFSYSEGQPLILLEALTADKKVIATDIPGNRSVLGNNYGKLIENNSQAIINAFLNYQEKKKFDVIDYNEMITKKYQNKMK